MNAGLKEEEEKAGRYLDMNRFNVFLEDTVDLESLLYETAMVLRTVTESSGKPETKSVTLAIC